MKREPTTQKRLAGPSIHADDFPFLLSVSRSLNMVEGKEDFLKRMMSVHTVIMYLQLFSPRAFIYFGGFA